MAREEYVNEEDLAFEQQQSLKSIAENSLPAEYQYLDSEDLNINRMIAHNPQLMDIFQEFVKGVWRNTGVSEYKRELISLAVISEFKVKYEWNQHVRVALTENLSPADIRNISNRDLEEFTKEEVTLIEYAEAYAQQDVDDTIYATLSGHFAKPTVIGITMVASIYVMTCHFARAFDLDLEAPFVGWQLENL